MFEFRKKNDEVDVKKKALTDTLGIDLGTLNTVVAKPSGDKFDLYKIPSVVAVKKEDYLMYWLLVKKQNQCLEEHQKIL